METFSSITPRIKSVLPYGVALCLTLVFAFATNSVFGYGAGLAVTSQDVIRSYATADNSYANGFLFRLQVAIDNTNESRVRMRFADWTSGSGSTIPASSNMQIATTSGGSGALSVDNAYPSGSLTATTLGGSGGLVQDVYVFLKVPVGTAGGSYSTTYGLRSDTN